MSPPSAASRAHLLKYDISSYNQDIFSDTTSNEDEEEDVMIEREVLILDSEEKHYFVSHNQFGELNEGLENGSEALEQLIQDYGRLETSLSDKPEVMPASLNFREINRYLKSFVRGIETELQFEPMPPVARRFLHELAQMYQLKTVTVNENCVKATRTDRTRLPNDFKKLDRLIEQAAKAIRFSSYGQHKQKPHGKRGKLKERKTEEEKQTVTKTKVVGGDAKPLDESNVGMQLLQKMGWKQGNTIGKQQDARTEPIEAIVRKKRAGL